jgi:hypothetical protein
MFGNLRNINDAINPYTNVIAASSTDPGCTAAYTNATSKTLQGTKPSVFNLVCRND